MTNTDPFRKWNYPEYKDDPSQPWNGPHRDNPFAPWNDPFGRDEDLNKWK